MFKKMDKTAKKTSAGTFKLNRRDWSNSQFDIVFSLQCVTAQRNSFIPPMYDTR